MGPRAGRGGRTRRPLVYQGRELRCTWEFEEEARVQGHAFVAGVDEVGRGALCGPVVAGAVILGEGFDAQGIDDSKRLTARKREELARRIREAARGWSLGWADSKEIDRFNILRATHLAVRRAVAGLPQPPDLLLIDAMTVPGIDTVQRPIVKGDALSVSIAAASIIAKVARDEMMQECDRRFPGYGLAHNMGYASEDHRAALRRLGPSGIHRRSFKGSERWLF